jgi:nicotinamidase-related amidase
MSEPLNAHQCALILIDHQVISMTLIKTQSPEIAKYNNITLVKMAKILAIPSVWTSSTEYENKDWWLPCLEEIDPDAYAHRIKRTGIINAWDDPDFVRAVEGTRRRTLIMAGTSNDGCLLYAALSARRAGYEVQVVLDAGGSVFEISENAARLRMMHEGIVMTATNTIIGELAMDWTLPQGRQLRQVLADAFEHTLGSFGLKA